MPTVRRFVAAVIVLGGLIGCESQLTVTNPNNPDRDRVLAAPLDVEQLIANAYVTSHRATMGEATFAGGGINDGLQPQLLVMGLENYSGNANFGMAVRGGLPRTFIDNSRGNRESPGNARDFVVLSRAGRAATDGLVALARPGFTLGSAAQDARARSFAKFAQGVAMGNLALAYDSATIFDENIEPGTIEPLAGYKEVMDAAIAALDAAIEVANNAPDGTNGFPLPASWLNTTSFSANGTVSKDDFLRIVRSYRARFRARVSRSPTEHATVNWALVAADATNGITTTWNVNATVANGWAVAWPNQHFQSVNWHQMWQFMIGMGAADNEYSNWLATPNGDKEPFTIVTPDKRFPQGADRDAQRANSPSPLPAGQYLRNRSPGDDVAAEPLATSFYDNYRFEPYSLAARSGPYPVMTKAEIDMIAAEAYLRMSPPNFAAAIALIDASREANGLPKVGNITSLTQPIAGGASCVPKVPQPPNFTSAACGNILEAMKWEFRMETAYTGWGSWYFAGRGWGDLPVGTAIHFPVPWQEMDARARPFYNLGGVGGVGAVTGPTTYGM